MWIVRLALRRPYSFTVMAILIVLVGVVTITRMSTDIFPNINIPVVSVIWSYTGVAPEEMEKRFVTVCERMTTTVNDSSGSAGGPRAESGGLPDSSSSGGKEGFAAGGRKGHASRVRPTTGILGALSSFLFAIHEGFNRAFEKIRDHYVEALRWCLSDRDVVFSTPPTTLSATRRPLFQLNLSAD